MLNGNGFSVMALLEALRNLVQSERVADIDSIGVRRDALHG